MNDNYPPLFVCIDVYIEVFVHLSVIIRPFLVLLHVITGGMRIRPFFLAFVDFNAVNNSTVIVY